MAFFTEGPYHTYRIVAPASFFSRFQLVQRAGQNACLREIDRVETHGAVGSLAENAEGSDGQSAGKYMAAVVIGMLTDQVYTTRCKIGFQLSAFSINLIKLLDQFLFHF